MDFLTFILVADAVVLIIATLVLTYYFFKDILKEKSEKKK